MKLQIDYKLFLYLLLIPFFAFANAESTPLKTSKDKTIQKSFNVNKDATLKVDNSFGNITIITWDENRIEFDINIKVSGNNDEKIEERLDGINIEFSSSSSLVSAITRIEKNKKNWWNWGSKASLKMEIDYVIKIPMTNNVNLRNKFGTIALDKLKGTSKIRCDHGKITTKELLSNTNIIDFNHTRDNYFEYIKNAEISATHSGFTVAKVENLNLDAQHTKSVIEIAEIVDYDCQHGSIKVDKVNNIKGDSQHLTVRIGDLYKSAKIYTTHGSLKIGRIASNANTVYIDSGFTSITVGYDTAFNFNFDLDFQHGSLRDTEEFNFTNKKVEQHDKRYEGYYGSQNSGNSIKISAQHGSVTFKKI